MIFRCSNWAVPEPGLSSGLKGLAIAMIRSCCKKKKSNSMSVYRVMLPQYRAVRMEAIIITNTNKFYLV